MNVDWEHVTSGATLGGLGALLLNKVVKGTDREGRLKQIVDLEAAILAIASAQYTIVLPLSDEATTRWRYADWILTTPLLLRTFYLLAEEKGYTNTDEFTIAVVANIIMIVAGYMSEFVVTSCRAKTLWYTVGMLALVVVLYHVWKWNEHLTTNGVDSSGLAAFFYLGWSAYGFANLMGETKQRSTVYNLLDFINKGAYSIMLDQLIEEYF
jgi:bacteriorhodopsin